MRWRNTETPTFTGSTGSGNYPAIAETFDLVDSSGTVLKRYSKAVTGALTESTVEYTAPVARVVIGTVATALAGTPAAIRVGGLSFTTVASGAGVPDDDDGTELAAYLQTNKNTIPADNVLDNEDGTFTITFLPGARANDYPTTSADAQLTFAESVEGADATNALTAVSYVTDMPAAGSAYVTVTETSSPGSALRVFKAVVAALPVTLANTTGISFGSALLLTLPSTGKFHLLSSNVEDFLWGLENAGNATPITGTMGGDFSLGTTATSDATLNSTDVNVLASTSYDPFSAAVDANSGINVVLASGAAIYLNAIIDDADVANAASDILEANGTFYFAGYTLA